MDMARRCCGLPFGNSRQGFFLICLLVVASLCQGKKSKKARSREKQTWTVAATSPLGSNQRSTFVHWVCFAKDDQVQASSSSSSRGERLSCCQEIFRLMSNEPQLCWQYPTGDCTGDDSSRASFLRLCSQSLAPVPSYPRHPEDDSNTTSITAITPARWSFVIADVGPARQYKPVEFWRQCISFSVSAGHWYYTVVSPYRLATETPTSEEQENSLSTNLTSAIKKGAIEFSLTFKSPPGTDDATTAPLKASFTVLVTLPEAVQLLKKGGKHVVHCSSKLDCGVETKIELPKLPTKTKERLPTNPQTVVAVLVDLSGAIQTSHSVQFQLSIPLRLTDDDVDAKVLSAPVLEGSHVEIEGRTFTLLQPRKQEFGKPLVLLADDDEDEEL